jgi:hypothetical protein
MMDDDTVQQGNLTPTNNSSSKKSIKASPGDPKELLAMTEKELAKAKEQVAQEKAAKRKLYSSLVKLANELKKTRSEMVPLQAAVDYNAQSWYEGGMWRRPEVLPGVSSAPEKSIVTRQAIGLSDLFFNIVTVTAFTRVGMAISEHNGLDAASLLYFAVFWMIWSKETSYSTRFDTTDLSAQIVTLLTCFALLFGSLSTTSPINSEDGTRIMMVAGFVAFLHFLLHVRVALWYRDAIPDTIEAYVRSFAIMTMVLTFLETSVWVVGIFVFPKDFEYRWAIFLAGVLLSMRIPRSFLSNDFHAACSRSGTIFILLLGFLLQSVVLVSSPFFEYTTPTLEQYAFLGSTCLMLFCIKLLYVDDSNTLVKDHALLVNRWAGFFFKIGQFALLLSTTVLGSGLDLLTHSYLAATAALPDNAKNLVCGGFSAVVFSIFFIKSMHLRRVPVDGYQRNLFLAAYSIQAFCMICIVFATARMCFSPRTYLSFLMSNETGMMFSLSGFALFLLLMSWLDEAVELSLYSTSDDSRQFMVHPFGLWWCLKPDLDTDEVEHVAAVESGSHGRLSQLSPLLGASVVDMKMSQRSLNYDSFKLSDAAEV